MTMRSGTLALLCATVLSGCAYVQSIRGDLSGQIDSWMQEHEYGKIIETVNHVSPSRSDYKELAAKRDEAVRRSQEYERSVVSHAQALTRANNWHEASRLYEAALEKIPESKPLNKAYTTFREQRSSYLAELNRRILLSKGNRLRIEVPAQEEILRVNPDDYDARHRHRQLQREAEETAEALTRCAETAIRAADYTLAKRCARLANELRPSEESEALLALATRRLNRVYAMRNPKPEPKPKQAKARKESPKPAKPTPPTASKASQSDLMQLYLRAYEANDLEAARRYMQRLRAKDKDSPKLKKLEAELNESIQVLVQEGISHGRELYSDGQIQPALDEWSRLLQLDPDNKELQDHIARAERVLEKIEKLSERHKAPPRTPASDGG
ncbi:MAG: hypothetical protein JSW10_10430 [Pseudomonadota bacterium]|nr:MAG: hypothetical protein JSW10_10430 [Pseudomonadota bacterium]